MLRLPLDRIVTFTGKHISVSDPDPELFCIEDIAHALSNICRFGGHAKKFYSVAEHSVIGAGIAPKEIKYDFLMHDASEGYIHDIARPVKTHLTGYKQLEEIFMTRLAEKFGFVYPLTPAISAIDDEVLQKEFDVLMLGESGSDIHFSCHEPVIAEKLFLESYNLLKK